MSGDCVYVVMGVVLRIVTGFRDFWGEEKPNAAAGSLPRAGGSRGLTPHPEQTRCSIPFQFILHTPVLYKGFRIM